MKNIKLRTKKIKINEEDIAQTITDPTLLNQSMQLQNEKQKKQEEFNKAQEEFNKKQEQYNKDMKNINDKFAQLLKQQATISKNKQSQNENIKYKGNKIFESQNKKDLLIDIITKVLKNKEYDFSYELSEDEIRRLSRKIYDYLNENKDKEIKWNKDVRYVIKNYILNHNLISWSQTEINTFNDELYDEIKNNEIYKDKFKEYID